MALDITIPEGSFEAKLLQDQFGKDSQCKWTTSKDAKEAEARTASGYAHNTHLLKREF